MAITSGGGAQSGVSEEAAKILGEAPMPNLPEEKVDPKLGIDGRPADPTKKSIESEPLSSV